MLAPREEDAAGTGWLQNIIHFLYSLFLSEYGRRLSCFLPIDSCFLYRRTSTGKKFQFCIV
jgi:hypothetical protein